MDRNQTTAAAGEVTPVTPPVTWISHVLVPLTQNVVGGVAVAGLGAIAVQAIAGQVTQAAWLWCALVGGVVTCVVTVLRFFGDDFGLYRAAYNAGRRSRDAQIAALQLQVSEANDAASFGDAAPSATIGKRQEMARAAHAHARLIIRVVFQGDSISRDAMADRGVGRRDWERAMALCRAAGVIDDEGKLTPRIAPKQALDAVAQLVAKDAPRMADGKFTPGWW
jgi:hypothetical protein